MVVAWVGVGSWGWVVGWVVGLGRWLGRGVWFVRRRRPCFSTRFFGRKPLEQDTVSEWSRRWTRNPLGSARRGSNPLGVVLRLRLPPNQPRCQSGNPKPQNHCWCLYVVFASLSWAPNKPSSNIEKRAPGGFWVGGAGCTHKTTARGFEPLRAEPKGFRVHLLDRSDALSCVSGLRA